MYHIKYQKELEDIISGISQKGKENYIKTHYPQLYQDIVDYCNKVNINPQPKKIKRIFKEKFYCWYNQLLEVSKCKKCSKNSRFVSFPTGYKPYCSMACSRDSDEVKEKRKQTCLRIHGVDNVRKSPEIIEKIKQTNLTSYGVTNINKLPEFREKIYKTLEEKYNITDGKQWLSSHRLKKGDPRLKLARIKQKKTYQEKYGTNTHFTTEEGRLQRIKTCLKKYGTEHWSSSDFIKEKKKQTAIENIKEKYSNLPNYTFVTSNLETTTLLHHKCNKECTQQTSFFGQRKVQKIELCTYCKPISDPWISNTHGEITDFLKSIYFKEISINNRKILNNLELDIYLPDANLAIEINGLYWHSHIYKSRNYHLNKTKLCSEQGIRLIHVFDDEWKNNPHIIKFKLKLLLNSIDNSRIHARKCIVKEVSTKEEREFLVNNHLQGYVASKFCYGLYYNKELVVLMSWGSLRRALGEVNKENVYELLRLCSKNDIIINGGVSKLYHFFIKQHNPKKVISYCDLRWSIGKVYERLGMSFVKYTVPNYWYVFGSKREHRYKYRKDILVSQGEDSSLTEFEIMDKRGINHIWDCGNIKYEQIFE